MCGALHRETVKMDETFGAGINLPPAHPNCRCVVSYHVEPIDLPEEPLQAPFAGDIISASDVDILIERGSNGNPAAIVHFDFDLNRRQQRLLDKLPVYGSRAEVSKRSVSMKDLSAMTAKTGDEFAMFTKGDTRLVVRGSSTNTPVTYADAEQLAAAGYRWSGHTHPGWGNNVMTASSGDYAILRAFRHATSVIYDSLGRHQTFGDE